MDCKDGKCSVHYICVVLEMDRDGLGVCPFCMHACFHEFFPPPTTEKRTLYCTIRLRITDMPLEW